MSEAKGEAKPHGRPMPGTSGHGTHAVDVVEHGAPRDGNPQDMNRRLFMQLVAFRSDKMPAHEAIAEVGGSLTKRGAAAVIYEDVNDPHGLAVLSWSEDPAAFVDKVRPALAPYWSTLSYRPELAMLGRTYSTGFEDNLPFWLLERPVNTVRNDAWPWAVWYPLRRSGAFARLPAQEAGGILREHAAIGRAYGEQDLAHDVRLACHGLDQKDNEFVIGLVGKELYPLSHVVQAMRKTRQTSEFIVQMGPFFVGRRVFKTP